MRSGATSFSRPRLDVRGFAAPTSWLAIKGSRLVAALVGAGLALLLIAWVPATRPFGAPDEADHYLRAMEIANGHLLGPKVPWLDPTITPAQRAWATKDSRATVVSRRLSPPDRVCTSGTPAAEERSCAEATHTGDYNPVPYVLPAAALAVADSADGGDFLARAASALECGAFLMLALALLWRGSLQSLIGLLVAITPMVLFVSSVVNPNGLQIAAALAFAAALLRIARDPAGSGRWGWIALGTSGAATVLSWQLGPVFMLVEIVLIWAPLGRGGLGEVWRTHRSHAIVTACVIAVSLVLYVAWSLHAGQFHSTVSVTPVGANLELGLRQLGGIIHQLVGVFGALTIPLPKVVYWLWWGIVAVLGFAALAVGSSRERAQLVVVTLVAFAFPVLFHAWIYHYTGFPMQGRYVLPVLLLVPLVAGQVLSGRGRPAVGLLVYPITALIAVLQLLAWWVAARNAAGAPTAKLFQNKAVWTPPLGWWVWTVLAILGAGALLAAAVFEGLVAARAGRTRTIRSELQL